MAKKLIGAVIALLLLMPGSEALAQGMKWRGSGGWGPGGPYGRMYDPKTVETVTGEVVKVDRIVPMHGMSGSVHLVVKTDKRDVSVHLGPPVVPGEPGREDCAEGRGGDHQVAGHDAGAIRADCRRGEEG
jgi:hypothetical protein